MSTLKDLRTETIEMDVKRRQRDNASDGEMDSADCVGSSKEFSRDQRYGINAVSMWY